MKQTVVGVFDSALRANEVVHVLVAARFEAERLPRVGQGSPPTTRSAMARLLDAAARRFRDFMDADMDLQPDARALAKRCFVVKVHAVDDSEALCARRILEAAGGKQIDVLADEWVEG